MGLGYPRPEEVPAITFAVEGLPVLFDLFRFSAPGRSCGLPILLLFQVAAGFCRWKQRYSAISC